MSVIIIYIHERGKEVIYLLLLSIVLICIISYVINDGDIMMPSILMCIGYIISILSAIYNIDNWGINLHFKTYYCIICGISVFVLMEWIINLMNKRANKSIKKQAKYNNIKYMDIRVENYKLFIVIVFSIIVILLYFKEVYRISLIGGNPGGVKNMMTYYRSINSYSTNLSVDDGINGIVSLLSKGVYVSGYIFMFIFLNNVIYAKQKIKNNIKYIIPTVLYVLQTFLNGARIYLIYVATASIVMSYVLYKRREGWNSNIVFKYIKIGCISAVTVFSIFFLAKGFVGRVTEASAMEYITNYAGGSIQLLDDYFQNPPESDGHFGSETLIGIQKLLYKLKLSDYKRITHLEFRQLGSNSKGNVYTALRRYYQDFGMSGVIICQLILSAAYCIFYNKIKQQRRFNKEDNYWLIVYCIIIPAMVVHSIIDVFYMEIISVGYLAQFILLRLAYWFFVNLKIKR